MKITKIRDPETWMRHYAMLRKQLSHAFRDDCESTPIFVLGNQRSGTSMLMRVFHRHTNTLVFDEHRNNPAFENYCIRSTAEIQSLIERARFPIVSFKPICDSHLVGELNSAFPSARIIWIYRNYADVSYSTLRKFENPTRAIRLVCTNQTGGGWFQDGVSPQISKVLKKVYQPDMSDTDLTCLVWWARNQILIESGLIGAQNVIILKYEALVSQPTLMLKWLFDQLEVEYQDRVGRKITARFVGRHSLPDIDATVQSLCESTLKDLDSGFQAGSPP